jgi:hypothetical protein
VQLSADAVTDQQELRRLALEGLPRLQHSQEATLAIVRSASVRTLFGIHDPRAGHAVSTGRPKRNGGRPEAGAALEAALSDANTQSALELAKGTKVGGESWGAQLDRSGLHV